MAGPVKYEYSFCMSQDGHMTYKDDKWLGQGQPSLQDTFTCPLELEFTNKMADESWELMNVIGEKYAGGQARFFYFRRVILSEDVTYFGF